MDLGEQALEIKNRTNYHFILIVLIMLVTIISSIHAQVDNTRDPNEFGSPPGTYEILSEKERIIIPFEFYRNKFRFKVNIYNYECNMMLDNGSLWDEILFFGSPKVDSLGFQFAGETSLGHSKADITSNFSIQFNDVVFDNQTVTGFSIIKTEVQITVLTRFNGFIEL